MLNELTEKEIIIRIQELFMDLVGNIFYDPSHKYRFTSVTVPSDFNKDILNREMLNVLLELKGGNYGEFKDMEDALNALVNTLDGLMKHRQVLFLNDFHTEDYLKNKNIVLK